MPPELNQSKHPESSSSDAAPGELSNEARWEMGRIFAANTNACVDDEYASDEPLVSSVLSRVAACSQGGCQRARR